jgi:hypothetical protein
MVKLLVIAAGLGLAIPSAQACESKTHVHTTKMNVDQSTVASVTEQSVAASQSQPVLVQDDSAEQTVKESAK